jgi:hypothetical protein
LGRNEEKGSPSKKTGENKKNRKIKIKPRRNRSTMGEPNRTVQPGENYMLGNSSDGEL